MTFKQKLLQSFYPALMKMTKLLSWRNRIVAGSGQPSQSIYQLNFVDVFCQTRQLQEFIGKKILFVNIASDCGFTAQLQELQNLQNTFTGNLAIIGFPTNDFKQHAYSDEQAIHFCQSNFGVSFPLSSRSVVVKDSLQHPVYQWLTSSDQNGWNNRAPEWNFSKYLVDETGRLTHYFGPAVSPLDPKIENAIG